MRNPARHHPERAQTFLFHHLVLRVAQLFERIFQVIRPLPHLVFELLIQESALEKIAKPELHLNRIERLRDEIICPCKKRLPPSLGRHIRSQDHDREKNIFRNNLLQFLHHLIAIEVRHVQIRQHQVGLKFRKQRNRLTRIRRATPFQAAKELEHPLKQAYIRGLVVNDKNFCRRQCDTGHWADVDR